MDGTNNRKIEDENEDDEIYDDENDNKNETSNNVEKYNLTITGEITIDNKNKKISTIFNKMNINIDDSSSTYNFTKEGIEFQPDGSERDPLSETLKTYTVNFSDISEFKITKWETTRKIEDVKEVDQLTKAADELYVKVNRELQMPDAKKLFIENPNFKKEIVEKAQKKALSDDTIDAKAVTKMSPEEYLVFLTLNQENKDKFIKYKKSWIPNPFSSLKPAAAKSFKATRSLASLAGVRGGRKKTRKIRKYKKKNSCL